MLWMYFISCRQIDCSVRRHYPYSPHMLSLSLPVSVLVVVGCARAQMARVRKGKRSLSSAGSICLICNILGLHFHPSPNSNIPSPCPSIPRPHSTCRAPPARGKPQRTKSNENNIKPYSSASTWGSHHVTYGRDLVWVYISLFSCSHLLFLFPLHFKNCFIAFPTILKTIFNYPFIPFVYKMITIPTKMTRKIV